MDADDTKSLLPWQWILEHLIGIPSVGTPILRELLNYVPEITLSNSLQQRLALRYLEETVSARRIDENAIFLLTTLAERASDSSYPTRLDYSDLLLRVRVEAVLTFIRARPRDWQGFSQAVDVFFPSDMEDNLYLEKRKQFVGLLQIRSEKKCNELLESYCLDALQSDIVKCIASEKARIEGTYLDKLLQDEVESQEDFHSADMQRISIGSDDQTGIATRQSNDESEEDIASGHKEPVMIGSANSKISRPQTTEKLPAEKLKKRLHGRIVFSESKSKVSGSDSKPQLRQRDRYGKAITSSRSVKDACDSETLVCSEMATDNKDVPKKEDCCYKCRKGGELLHCHGCPIIVHRKCLGSDSIDIVEGEWFCPLCLQKKAAEAVAKAREEEMAARERVARFMAELNIDRELGKENLSVASLTTLVDAKMDARADSDTNRSANGKKAVDHARADSDMNRSANGKKAVDHADSVNTGKQEEMKAVPEGAIHINIDLPEEVESQKASRNEIWDSCDHHHVTGSGGDRLKRIRGLIAADAICGTPKEDVAGVSSKTEAELQNHTGQVNVQQLRVADGDGHDCDIEESGDGDVENKYLKGKPKNKLREKSLILGRRKRIPWSKEEEDALKEGVKRFSHDGAWGFKWTRILEFGHGKFHPSRTDVDLKDKWRNITKTI